MAINKTISFDPITAKNLEDAAALSGTDQSKVVKAGVILVSEALTKDQQAVKKILMVQKLDGTQKINMDAVTADEVAGRC